MTKPNTSPESLRPQLFCTVSRAKFRQKADHQDGNTKGHFSKQNPVGVRLPVDGFLPTIPLLNRMIKTDSIKLEPVLLGQQFGQKIDFYYSFLPRRFTYCKNFN